MIDAIRNRRSIRNYTGEAVSDDHVEQILHSAMFAPSAWDRRPWHFIVVRDKETLRELSLTQKWSDFVADSAVTIVVCGDKEVADLWVEDCSIAATYILLAAAALGLGSCWTAVKSSEREEGDPEAYVRHILGIPDRFGVLCMLPIGHPAEDLAWHSDSEFDHTKISRETFGH